MIPVAETLYRELADWWSVMSPPDGYADEAARYAALLDEIAAPTRVLELGSGGGHNACHLKHRYAMTLVDRSSAMLAVSRRRNPECRHVLGDMRDVRLTEEFDAVFIHDAIDYLRTPLDLAVTLANARAHCRKGGAVLLVPDHFLETFEPGVQHGGGDEPGRSLRYLEWSHAPEPGATQYRVDYAFVLRDGAGRTRVVHDVHQCGLFPREFWRESCEAASLAPEIRTIVHADPEVGEREVLLCRAV